MVMIGTFLLDIAQRHDGVLGMNSPGAALAQTTCPVGQYRAEYFSNTSLSGDPVAVRCEVSINYRWGTSEPISGVGKDNFSVRWVGRHRFDGGTYRFSVSIDDGIRFWLDGVLTLNEWRSQASGFERQRTLTAGDHEIKVEYYEGSATSTVQLDWELLTPAPSTATPRPTESSPTATRTPAPTQPPTATQGPTSSGTPASATCPTGQYRAEYFPNQTLSGSPAFTRCESSINNRWEYGGPGGQVGPDGFSVRWVGRHNFKAGTYAFQVFADDGVRIWIDGARALDEWQSQARTFQFQRDLTDGSHEIRVEYFEGGGTSSIVSGWERLGSSPPATTTATPTATLQPSATPSQASCPLGEYLAEYFANDSFSSAPIASRCERAPIASDWQYGAPYSSLPRDEFSVRYLGRFMFEEGDHTFTTTADDGVRVWLNGTILIDNTANRPGTYTATRSFPPGVVGEPHELKVEFVELGGAARIAFGWVRNADGQPDPTSTPTPVGTANPTPTPTGIAAPGASCTRTDIDLPDGFCIDDFATGLTAVRFMAYSPGGVLHATLPSQGRVVRLPDANGDGKADGVFTFASGLNRPHGLVFHNGYLYVAETNSLTRLRDTDGDGDSDQTQRLAPLPGDTVHWTRTVIVGADGELYISIGSSCDACVEGDPRRATVMQFNADGSGGRVYSRGLRNAVGLARHPSTGQIWADGNERDGLGDDFPREILSRLIDGADYGWPRCTNGITPDTRFSGGCAGVTQPVMTFQAHSAPLGMAFYTGSAFPAQFRDNLFIAFHGSWNRSVPTGYKVVRVPFTNGQPTGQVHDFAAGWLRSDHTVAGRPVDVVMAPDGALMLSDDRANRIYRIVYRGSS